LSHHVLQNAKDRSDALSSSPVGGQARRRLPEREGRY
jgi:hypothetical protein